MLHSVWNVKIRLNSIRIESVNIRNCVCVRSELNYTKKKKSEEFCDVTYTHLFAKQNKTKTDNLFASQDNSIIF